MKPTFAPTLIKQRRVNKTQASQHVFAAFNVKSTMSTKCVFNLKWELNVSYRDWLKSLKSDKHKAFCCVCDCVIDITTMGESALKSYVKAEKHKVNIQQLQTKSMVTISSFSKKSTGDDLKEKETVPLVAADMALPYPPANLNMTVL